MPENDKGGPDAKLAEQKDALDVAIAHERAELDRLQRRSDRADTQAAAITASASAVAALAASVLAAVHRHIGVAAIVFASIGGACVAAAVIVSFIGREPRFSGPWTWASSPRLLRMADRIDRLLGQGATDWTSLIEGFESMRAMLTRLGVSVPDRPDASDTEGVAAYFHQVLEDMRRLQEDRFLAPLRLVEVSALDLRQNIASTLLVRTTFLERLTEWRERMGRISLVLVVLGVPSLAISVTVTVA